MTKKENRGGKRSNPGGRPKTPPKQYDEDLKKRILAAIRKHEKEVKRTVEEAFVELLFDKNTQASVKQAAFKLYFDLFVPKQVKVDVDVPKICLPPIKEPPKGE
jgi:hypothetical protein